MVEWLGGFRVLLGGSLGDVSFVCGGAGVWVGKIRQRAEFAGWRGRGVLANICVGLLGGEEKEIVPETTVMEEECRFHLSVSSVKFNKRQTWRKG